MSLFALDTSATLPWCFTEEATAATEALLDRLRSGDQAIAPAHWPAEVMNALAMACGENESMQAVSSNLRKRWLRCR